MLTLYDVDSPLAAKSWSPSTRKAICTLKLKKLPYTVTYKPFNEIEKTCLELGASPTSTRPNGKPWFTFPVLHDSSTGEAISDSLEIAKYLDKQYPDTRRAIPAGTLALQTAFVAAFEGNYMAPLLKFTMPKTPEMLQPTKENADAFCKSWEPVVGVPLAKMLPSGNEQEAVWKSVKAGFGWVDSSIKSAGAKYLSGGESPTFADFVVAGRLYWTRAVWGEDSKEWEEIATWHGGRWAQLLRDLEAL